MFKYLDNLRKKPDYYKKRFSILVSFLVVSLIFVVWLSVIYPDVKNITKKKAEIRKDPTPTNAILGNIFEGFRSLGDSFKGLNAVVSELGNDIENSYYLASSTNNIIDSETQIYSETASSTLQIDQESDLSTTTKMESKGDNSN